MSKDWREVKKGSWISEGREFQVERTAKPLGRGMLNLCQKSMEAWNRVGEKGHEMKSEKC